MADNPIFDQTDIETLIDALDAWEVAPSTSSMVGAIITSMLIKDEDKSKQMMEDSRQRTETEVSKRKMRAIRLKAKLVELSETQIIKNAITEDPA